MMRLSVLLLLLFAYVSSGRSETRAGLLRRNKGTSSREELAKRLAEFSAVPLNRISNHVTSRISALDARLTLMNLNAPVLSASSLQASTSSEPLPYSSPEPQETIVKPSLSPVPGIISKGSVSDDEPLTIPTATPNSIAQPTEPDIIATDEPHESSVYATSSTPEPKTVAPRFRKFNFDGSLSTVFASQTPTPQIALISTQEHGSSGNIFPATTSEAEVEIFPEATGTVYDEDNIMELTAEEESRLPSSAEPELTPLPAQNETKFDAETPKKYSEATEEEYERESPNVKPRLSASAFGPVTATAVWTSGQPPDVSISFSSDTEEDGQNPVENEGKTQDLSDGESGHSFGSSSDMEEELIESSPEQETGNLEGSEGFGRQMTKNPIRPDKSGGSPALTTNVSQGASVAFDDAAEPKNADIETEASIDSRVDSTQAHTSHSPSVSTDSNSKVNATNQVIVGGMVPPASHEDPVVDLAFPGPYMNEQDTEVDAVQISAVQISATETPEDYGSSHVHSDGMEWIYPDSSEEPAASAELLSPSQEPELLSVALIVRHPPSYDSEKLGEDIRINSNEFIAPDEWEIASLLLLSNLTRSFHGDLSSRQVQTNQDTDDSVAFELLLEAECSAGAACASKMEKYEAFIRGGRMDAALATHDFTRVSVFLQGETKERSVPMAAIGPSGLGVGVIAGIAVGAVAAVSLVILAVVVVMNRTSDSSEYNTSEYSDSDLEYEDDVERESDFIQNGESFMISNFGGTPRTTFANIPWLNHTTAESGQEAGSQSFISVDSMMTNDNNTMSQYRFDETTSSSSKSDLEDLENPADIPVSAEGPDASGSTVYIVQ